MQAYAAVCLSTYCKHYNIKHESINQLINHLFSILISDDISCWEQLGASLDLTGRGDPLPDDVDYEIPVHLKDEFVSLLDTCVEVGEL